MVAVDLQCSREVVYLDNNIEVVDFDRNMVAIDLAT